MCISVNLHGIHTATDGIMVYALISLKVKFGSPSSPLALPVRLRGVFEGGAQLTLLLNLMKNHLKQRHVS